MIKRESRNNGFWEEVLGKTHHVLSSKKDCHRAYPTRPRDFYCWPWLDLTAAANPLGRLSSVPPSPQIILDLHTGFQFSPRKHTRAIGQPWVALLTRTLLFGLGSFSLSLVRGLLWFGTQTHHTSTPAGLLSSLFAGSPLSCSFDARGTRNPRRSLGFFPARIFLDPIRSSILQPRSSSSLWISPE